MKLGLIGAGNMAGAIVRGIINNKFVLPSDVFISDVAVSQAEALRKDTRVNIAKDNIDLVKGADVIVLAVKPIFLAEVLKQVKPFMHGKTIISIVTGWSHDRILEALQGVRDLQIVCVMPNTPAHVGEGMTAIVAENSLSADMLAYTKALFNAIGRTTLLPERLMEGYIAVCGSGPAYVYMFIEAMADAAVREGLPRELAYEAASQAVRGAATMVLESGTHPAKLKDAVCSPGGTTIEAVIELEKGGMRGAVMSAVAANAQKARLLAKK